MCVYVCAICDSLIDFEIAEGSSSSAYTWLNGRLVRACLQGGEKEDDGRMCSRDAVVAVAVVVVAAAAAPSSPPQMSPGKHPIAGLSSLSLSARTARRGLCVINAFCKWKGLPSLD